MDDDTALVRNTVVSAAATHYDPRCIWSAVLVNLAVASLARGAAVDPGELASRAAGAARELGAALAPFGLQEPGCSSRRRSPARFPASCRRPRRRSASTAPPWAIP